VGQGAALQVGNATGNTALQNQISTVSTQGTNGITTLVDANGDPMAIANGVTYLGNATGTTVGGEVGTGLQTGVTGVANSAANYANGDHAAATTGLINGASTIVTPYNTAVADSLSGTA